MTAIERRSVFIGAASGWGSQDPGADAGPEFLRRHGVIEAVREKGQDAAWLTTVG